MAEKDFDLLVEAIGGMGSIAILTAYALNSYQKIRSESVLFLMLNLTGGLLLIAYSFYKDAPANIFLNLVWVIVAVIALGKLYHRHNTKRGKF
jgi:lipid-A-disaccharide synthase-like uncharacterized protein